MGLKHFLIVLDRDPPVYTSGEPVSGRLLISVDAPEHILGVTIYFKGDTYVEWKKTFYNHDSPLHTTTYFSKETYFDKRYNFLVAGECTFPGGETVILRGEHSYPFRAVLPDNLPNSFESKYGRVRYSVRAVCTMVKVTMSRPREVDIESRSDFTVIHPLDLNILTGAQDELCVCCEKYFSSCKRAGGYARLTAKAPYRAFVPGQNIPVTVAVEGGAKIIAFMCTLRANLSYLAKDPFHNVKMETEKILELRYGAGLRINTKTWSLPFPLPPLPPSDMLGCSLIELSYELQIKGMVSGYKDTIDLILPLTLGTIPFTKIPRLDLLPIRM